jgi:hypothetical protein
MKNRRKLAIALGRKCAHRAAYLFVQQQAKFWRVGYVCDHTWQTS